MSRSGLQRELTKNQKIEAAINNEVVTRKRVDQLEHDIRFVGERLGVHDSILMIHDTRGGFWGRLKWLVLGK